MKFLVEFFNKGTFSEIKSTYIISGNKKFETEIEFNEDLINDVKRSLGYKMAEEVAKDKRFINFVVDELMKDEEFALLIRKTMQDDFKAKIGNFFGYHGRY